MTLFSQVRPKIKTRPEKGEGYDGWTKCSRCHELIHQIQLEESLHLCPKCGYHFRISATARIELLADGGSFKELFTEIQPTDPIGFHDTESYATRLRSAQKKTGRDEAVIVGSCTLEERPIALAVMDFAFMGGSMGSVVGERLTALIEWAIYSCRGVLIVSASGGARMQESVLSLMQMAKTSAALARLSEEGLPYISLLTHPTTGGVIASFATLGDIILAEPDALLGFTGPRVIEQTIRQKLPPKAQKSEFLLEHGMVDDVVSRDKLKETIGQFFDFLMR